ncbi:postreplication repair E3 ubiquitin-protein ligase RAD18-like [Teleopsis dalmanni]|uniref:postreplication repair E3 ubiquitin-protein ligase RAD18-like n=1 Tax=Teleopsis dalmanni TaxID=139649 RepID=UPI0018CF8862|nr:postreplication repair E3 ubiquitin-protein ligase RAD18-like [Teleopsis dalmanni]XP_037939195.1 postreplication repair E3 ubiquitin-protein ligase RAD18-like [Teleopsis dalmanni]XP_037940185.1 postreplication repair E3 ubiquitin-protein ligase RAD18-like [Teleopsis dalmanni]
MDETELFCVICQNKVVDMVQLNCGHDFCNICLKNLVSYANKKKRGRYRCPLCKKDFIETKDGYLTVEESAYYSTESDTDTDNELVEMVFDIDCELVTDTEMNMDDDNKVNESDSSTNSDSGTESDSSTESATDIEKGLHIAITISSKQLPTDTDMADYDDKNE